MMDSDKLWVIEIGDDCGIEKTPEPPPPPPRNIKQPVAAPRPVVRKPVAAPRQQPMGRLHFALRLALTYLLGPFALLLWPATRRRTRLVVLSLLSGMGAVVLAWQWRNIVALDASGSLVVPLLLVSIALGCQAFTGWAMALSAGFGSRISSAVTLPARLRTGWAVTGLGLLAPGLGLYLAGVRRGAAAGLWSVWPVYPAALLLIHGQWTWQWLGRATAAPVGQAGFEHLLLAAAGIALLGLLAWLVQALVGLHVRTRWSPGIPAHNGDRYALALLVAVVSLFIFAPPADLASVVSLVGDHLHAQGFRQIPLQLVRSAQALNPGEPAYAMQLADLQQDPGDDGMAPPAPASALAAPEQRDPGQDAQAYVGMMARPAPPPAAVETQVSPAHTLGFDGTPRGEGQDRLGKTTGTENPPPLAD